jgi:hypothetical protein
MAFFSCCWRGFRRIEKNEKRGKERIKGKKEKKGRKRKGRKEERGVSLAIFLL